MELYQIRTSLRAKISKIVLKCIMKNEASYQELKEKKRAETEKECNATSIC